MSWRHELARACERAARRPVPATEYGPGAMGLPLGGGSLLSLAAELRAGEVQRHHCARCDRCGFVLADNAPAGCRPGNCSMRPLPELRDTCAGCGVALEPVEPWG